MTTPLLHARGLGITTPHGRMLVSDLSLELGRDQVALIGRNGVGKSSLLRVLAGHVAADGGTLRCTAQPILVPQDLECEVVRQAATSVIERARGDLRLGSRIAQDLEALHLPPLAKLLARARSRGEDRKLLLVAAKHAGSPLVLLDEPTDDLDDGAIAWLRAWVANWRGALIVASHHRGLLRDFEHFFVVDEAGCRHLCGRFEDVERTLAANARAREQRYVAQLHRLDRGEHRDEQIRRRRARKTNVGRIHELDRCTPRMRLGRKRAQAQVNAGKAARVRHDRAAAVRAWSRAARRAMAATLPLRLQIPRFADGDGEALVALQQITMEFGSRVLFRGIDLTLDRSRVAVTGPNGAGKTTLLRLAVGREQPSHGHVYRQHQRIGLVDQGATDWITDASLLTRLLELHPERSLDSVAQAVVAHGFPLALAERPGRSLSAGERVRAALIELFARAPEVELLVLDEPTYGLDLEGLVALERALRAWPGGLLVASHDRDFLAKIAIERTLVLDDCGRHRLASANRKPEGDRALSR